MRGFHMSEPHTVSMYNDQLTINGKTLPPLPKKYNSYTSSVIDGRVFVNGYEFKFNENKWKRTLRAIFQYVF